MKKKIENCFQITFAASDSGKEKTKGKGKKGGKGILKERKWEWEQQWERDGEPEREEWEWKWRQEQDEKLEKNIRMNCCYNWQNSSSKKTNNRVFMFDFHFPSLFYNLFLVTKVTLCHF